jgi:hypothetical protein
VVVGDIPPLPQSQPHLLSRPKRLHGPCTLPIGRWKEPFFVFPSRARRNRAAGVRGLLGYWSFAGELNRAQLWFAPYIWYDRTVGCSGKGDGSLKLKD